MDSTKYSRLAALRPVRPAVSAVRPGGIERRPDLAALVAGCRRLNDLGEHLAARTASAGEECPDEAAACVRRIAPLAPPEAADPRRWLFLDTETTGLAGGTGTYAFLVGLAWWEEGVLAIEQLFMHDHGEEPSLLLEVARRMQERPVLVTYNGRSFDWPLLETRFRMTRAARLPEPAGHLDLLHPARQIWRYRLGSFALAEVERQILRRERDSDIPSETIPQRYFEFLRGGPAGPVAEVFRHNQLDLRGLAALATHMARLLGDPQGARLGAAELYGVSRILRRRGELPLAGEVCRDALSRGLEEEPGRRARMDLSLDARRRRDFSEAETLLLGLVGGSPSGLAAYEQLAIVYEHRRREPARAAALVRQALVDLREAASAGRIAAQGYRAWHGRLQHRLDRLTRKTVF